MRVCGVLLSATRRDVDILVSGGGLVGAALAVALGKSPRLKEKKIVLLEAASENVKFDISKYSNRVVSINPGTRCFLERLGAWNEIAAVRCQPVKRLQVWEACSDASIVFNQPSMDEDVSYIVENDLILTSLRKCLSETDVEVLYQTRGKKYILPVEQEDLVETELSDGSVVASKLLVGADGYGSLVRQTMGVEYINWKYGQNGIVATLNLSEPTANNVAWQRFLPTGPIAILPLNDSTSSLVWSVTEEQAKNLMKLSDEEFVDAINAALWDDSKRDSVADSVLSSFVKFTRNFSPGGSAVRQMPPSIQSVVAASRAAFPLGLGHAVNYVQHRVALVGDAAHRVHPLAGQGVNLGFGDVECLTRVLDKAVGCGSDIGSLLYLCEYETERQRQVVPVQAVIDGLHRLYTTTFTPIVLMRSLGLSLTNSSPLLKSVIMDRASC